jgi:hypothetical protein
MEPLRSLMAEITLMSSLALPGKHHAHVMLLLLMLFPLICQC